MSKAVENNAPVRGLSEVFQNNETRFALCRYDSKIDKVIQCHQFVKCRDFMMDVLVGYEDNKDMKIYGFQYTTDLPRPSSMSTDLLMKMPNEGALKNFQTNFPILKDIEDALGWGITFPDLVEYPDKVVVLWVCGDPRWQRTCFSLSLYTYILKCLTYPIQDKTKWMEEIKAMNGTVEAGYMDIPHIRYLLTNLQDLIDCFTTVSGFPNQKEVDTGTIHNSTGFVSMKSVITGHQYGNKNHVLYNYEKKTAKVAA